MTWLNEDKPEFIAEVSAIIYLYKLVILHFNTIF
jgi:hypothetical protein